MNRFIDGSMTAREIVEALKEHDRQIAIAKDSPDGSVRELVLTARQNGRLAYALYHREVGDETWRRDYGEELSEEDMGKFFKHEF